MPFPNRGSERFVKNTEPAWSSELCLHFGSFIFRALGRTEAVAKIDEAILQFSVCHPCALVLIIFNTPIIHLSAWLLVGAFERVVFTLPIYSQPSAAKP